MRGEGCASISLCSAVSTPQGLIAVSAVAVNSDGASASMTAPNGLAQQSLICRTISQTRAVPKYISTHGTGTVLGDPLEVGAIEAALNPANIGTPLVLGALKSCIGSQASRLIC